MPSIRPIKWKVLECVFEKAGLKYIRQTSIIRCYWKEGLKRPVMIPVKKKELGLDIIFSNMRTANMTRDEYLWELYT